MECPRAAGMHASASGSRGGPWVTSARLCRGPPAVSHVHCDHRRRYAGRRPAQPARGAPQPRHPRRRRTRGAGGRDRREAVRPERHGGGPDPALPGRLPSRAAGAARRGGRRLPAGGPAARRGAGVRRRRPAGGAIRGARRLGAGADAPEDLTGIRPSPHRRRGRAPGRPPGLLRGAHRPRPVRRGGHSAAVVPAGPGRRRGLRLLRRGLAELLRALTGFEGAMVHERCRGRGDDTCRWLAAAAEGYP